MLKEGFYCALGTPLDHEGRLIAHSLHRHIEDQIKHGAAGLLLMGTMGMLGCIRDDQYELIVREAVAAVKGRVPLLVGAADNSIARMQQRLAILDKYPVSAVLTAPYYFGINRDTAMRYFKAAADVGSMDLYLYDHPFTARYKLTYDDVRELAALPRYKGIKTGDPVLMKKLILTSDIKADFAPIFSNSDLFSMGRPFGVKHVLDGIFACFPRTTGAMQKAWDQGDLAGGTAAVERIMAARDEMFGLGLWPAFTAAMNLLGYEGNFSPDYEPVYQPVEDEQKLNAVRALMQRTGEIGQDT